MPVTEALSWTLLGDDGDPVEPVETFLAFLSGLERSPNTVRDRAMSLKLWFEFLDRGSLRYDGEERTTATWGQRRTPTTTGRS